MGRSCPFARPFFHSACHFSGTAQWIPMVFCAVVFIADCHNCAVNVEEGQSPDVPLQQSPFPALIPWS